MSRSFITSAAVAAVCALGFLTVAPASARPHPTPTPSASPTPVPPPEDPAMTAMARHEFVTWQAGVVDKNRYTPAMQAQITADQVSQTSVNLSTAGALQRSEWVGLFAASAEVPGAKAYVYRMICTNRPVYEIMTIAPDGKIAGIRFTDHFG